MACGAPGVSVGSPTAGGAALAVRFEGTDHAITAAGLLIGRRIVGSASSPVDVALRADGPASHRHARIYLDGDGCWIVDLGSETGTFVNGEAVGEAPPRRLSAGDRVTVGDQELLLAPAAATPSTVTVTGTRLSELAGERAVAARPPSTVVPYAGRPLTIGRDPGNDLVLDDLNISRRHAVLEPGPDGPQLVDLRSRNGTRHEGVPIARATLSEGSQIGIGPYRLTFTGDELHAVSERGAVSIEAIGVTVRSDGVQILAPTSLKIHPAELVAIIGENGAGKTTLLKALGGITKPSDGVVLVNGEPVAQRSSELGYVPQTDTIHRWLTVEEALRFGARLRLPDASPAEIRAATERAITALALDGPLRNRIIGSEEERPKASRLSGGERKRACVAMEVLNDPTVVFLDEPTSPLDPWFGAELLHVLRHLAASDCSVVVVTHHDDDVPQCDKVAVLAKGGYLCYYGPPPGALEYFGVSTYADIYGALHAHSGPEWAERAGGEVPALRAAASADPVRPAVVPKPRRGLSLAEQTRVLAGRYALILRRDRANLLTMVLSVPALALMFYAAFGSDVFLAPPGGSEPNAPTFLFFLTFVVLLLGVIVSFREIVKERAIFRRERAIGLDVRAYVASKMLVLGAVGTIQAFALGALVFVTHPLHLGVGAYLGSFVVLAAVMLSGIGIGLLVSALVRSQEQATTFIAIPLALQLFFGGSIITLSQKGAGIDIPAAVMPARWSFAALGSLAQLDRFPRITTPIHYGSTFNDSWLVGLVILLALTAALTAVTALVLARVRD
jgi:ABC-type multidrug transport system ATPase subunit